MRNNAFRASTFYDFPIGYSYNSTLRRVKIFGDFDGG